MYAPSVDNFKTLNTARQQASTPHAPSVDNFKTLITAKQASALHAPSGLFSRPSLMAIQYTRQKKRQNRWSISRPSPHPNGRRQLSMLRQWRAPRELRQWRSSRELRQWSIKRAPSVEIIERAPSVESIERALSVESIERALSVESIERAPSVESIERALSVESIERAPSVEKCRASRASPQTPRRHQFCRPPLRACHMWIEQCTRQKQTCMDQDTRRSVQCVDDSRWRREHCRSRKPTLCTIERMATTCMGDTC